MTVTINGTTGIAGVDGSAATPAVQGADTNTGVFYGTDIVAVSTGGTERMRVNASGKVGIGTTTPAENLSVIGQVSVSGAVGGFLLRDRATNASSSQWYSPTVGSTRLYDNVAAVDRVIIDSSGNLSFNSGYGSAAVAYGCRAWVNFDGTTNTAGFCTIRGSGGVTSVADNGTGDYTVNFTTAMPDVNYAVSNGSMSSGTTRGTVLTGNTLSQLTGSFRTELRQTDGAASGGTIAADITNVNLSFFR